MYEPIVHVFAQSSDKMKSLFKEQSAQGSGNVAPVPKELATQFFDHRGNRLTIIDIAWGQTTRKSLALVIDRQVQFKTEEPAHAALATLGIRREDAVLADPFGITDFQRRRVDEADPGTRSIAGLQVGKQRKHHRRDECNEARITHQVRKFLPPMYLDMFRVVRFEGSIVRLVKMDQNRHHLAWTELSCTLSLLACCQMASFPFWLKGEPKIIDSTKQFQSTHF